MTKTKMTRERKQLVEVRENKAPLCVIIAEFTCVAGNTIKASELHLLEKLKVCDIDDWSLNKKIVLAINRETGVDFIRVLHNRKLYGTQTALILIPMSQAMMEKDVSL